MRDTKRKRLEAKGWRVASAKEFLELSDEEDAYIELRLKLAEGLRQRRLGRGLTQVQLAKAVRSSQSRVAKMEAGDPTVSLDLLLRSLLALRTTSRELAQIITRGSRAA
jgi:ribosome-binding protein aMBF1 (putative translation factor)